MTIDTDALERAFVVQDLLNSSIAIERELGEHHQRRLYGAMGVVSQQHLAEILAQMLRGDDKFTVLLLAARGAPPAPPPRRHDTRWRNQLGQPGQRYAYRWLRGHTLVVQEDTHHAGRYHSRVDGIYAPRVAGVPLLYPTLGWAKSAAERVARSDYQFGATRENGI